MGEIKHSAELAEELRQDILSCVEQVRLGREDRVACRNVSADKECNASYQSGMEQTKKYRDHVANLTGFMAQVDQILQQADESAAKGNLEGSATITSLY